MVTIALDEYGRFEGLGRNSKEMPFVGGFLFDDCGNDSESKVERERICNYYNSIIDEVNKESSKNTLKYPAALHVSASADNKQEVALFKKKLNETIAEFIEHGTYCEKELAQSPRRGIYYIFANIRSESGRTELLQDNTSILLKDDFGSNLYFHMSVEIVSRVLFHNPVLNNIKEVTINLATRSTENLSEFSEKANEYRKLGFVENISNREKGKVYFSPASPDVYRSALAQSLLESGKISMKIKNFEIRSISYKCPKNMEFLYLADSICAVLARKSKHVGGSKLVESILNTADKINPGVTNLVFTYGRTDLMYKKAWQFFEEADYYEVLSTAYDIRKKQDELSKFYSKTWVSMLEKSVIEKANTYKLIIASKKLQANLRTNAVDQDKTLYIFQSLEKVAEALGEQTLVKTSPLELYDLFDSGITVYTHVGDSRKAQQCYEKCRAYAAHVDLDRFLVSLNKITVMHLDDFEWEKAKTTAKEGVECQEMLIELKNTLPIYDQNNSSNSTGLGKALSQLGQVYAFERNSECIPVFKRALSCFQENSADYKITQSYLLHHYLDMGNGQDYEPEATIYFGGANKPGDRLKYILEEAFKDNAIINYKYALYVFVRGLFCSGLNTLSDAIVDKLYNIDDILRKSEAKARPKSKLSFERLEGHPSEIIFKYIAFILDEKGRKNEAKEILGKIDDRVIFSGPTVNLINEYGKADYYKRAGDRTKEQEMLRGIDSILKESFSHLGTKSAEDLPEMMTFMYR